MALSEEQEETMVAEVLSMAKRLTSLGKRHHELVNERASLQLQPPASRHTGPDKGVRLCHDRLCPGSAAAMYRLMSTADIPVKSRSAVVSALHGFECSAPWLTCEKTTVVPPATFVLSP